MKKCIVYLALTVLMSMNAFALEVPMETMIQNLNGSQQAIKTYQLRPDQDPQILIEDPFELEGYRYTFADIVKTENAIHESKLHTETVTVETEKDDLSVILEALKPTMEYDDGVFHGTLNLDHSSLKTEAAGYVSKSYTVTDTKTIGPLDRNDMSYVPATTMKNGKTLKLANVEWEVIGTDLVGETLMPSAYQAIATYSAKSSYNAATGYITTAEYTGTVTHEGIEDVTYVLTYHGCEIAPEPEAPVDEPTPSSVVHTFLSDNWPYLLSGAAIILALCFGSLMLYYRKETKRRETTYALDAEIDTEQEETL